MTQTQTADPVEFVISRTFDAPRERVFQAWLDPEALARWWGPKGCALRVAALDARPGGLFHYAMTTPDGREMWGRFVYEEIAAPERLVFLTSFSDEAGGITRAPFGTAWPLETRSTLTFEAQGGQTVLTLRGVPVRATEEERQVFLGGHASMQQGFGGTLDQLAEFLADA